MDIIIFGGQSNMQGQSGEIPAINRPISGALEYHVVDDRLVPLQLPVGEDLGGNKYLLGASHESGSLIPAFCRAYINTTGREVIAISACRGDTTLVDWHKGTYRYYHAAKKIHAGIKKAKSVGEVEHIFYVWLQGEADAIIGTDETQYVENLIRYKEMLKADFGIEKFGIIKVGYFFCTSQWHTRLGTYESKKANDETIMRAQERAVEIDSDFIMLTRICAELSMKPEYINPRASGHYNNEALDMIGTAAGETLGKQCLKSAHSNT